jgi:hypothetical protein
MLWVASAARRIGAMPTPIDAIEPTDDQEIGRTGSVPRWSRASLDEQSGAHGARTEG